MVASLSFRNNEKGIERHRVSVTTANLLADEDRNSLEPWHPYLSRTSAKSKERCRSVEAPQRRHAGSLSSATVFTASKSLLFRVSSPHAEHRKLWCVAMLPPLCSGTSPSLHSDLLLPCVPAEEGQQRGDEEQWCGYHREQGYRYQHRYTSYQHDHCRENGLS